MAPLNFKSFIEESNDALAKLDGRGRVLLANRHWYSLLGAAGVGSIGAWPNVMEALARVGSGEVTFESEVTERLVPIRGALVRLVAADSPDDGRILCRVRPAQVGLAATRDRFFTLIDSFPFAIGVHRDLRFLYVNQTAVRYLGYDRSDELVGLPIVSIISQDELPAVQQRVAHMMRTGLPLPERETRLLRRDGGVVVADLAAFMIRDEDGLPSYVVVARDISERRTLEERLRQSQRMEAVGRLAGGIAHEFNNVLAVVLTYAELIASQRGGLDVPQAAAEISKAAERAAKLVKELLTFSRGRVSENTWQSPNRCIEGLRDFLQRSVGESVRLELELGPQVPLVRAGASHLEQVFVNLVLNARDALPRGGRVVVKTRVEVVEGESAGAPPDLDPAAYVVLEVEDDGVGMAPEVARRAFEPFYTTKGTGVGTGLGLATVYGIARQAGGTAELVSEAGRGTRVRIWWPVDPNAPSELPGGDAGILASTAKASGAQVPVARPAGKLLSGRRVHLVEDDEAVRVLVTRLLRHHGAEVLESQSASHALALQEQLRIRGDELPSLMLTDVVMPDKSGPDLAREMRHIQPDLKLVFMSGYADDNLDTEAIKALGARFIEKPFAPSELVTLLAEAFGAPAKG